VKRAWRFIYAAMLLGVIGWLNFITADDRQYSRLAESFLDGKLFLLATPPKNWADTAPFDGRHYSSLGPFPAVLIMPLVWSGYFHQGHCSSLPALPYSIFAFAWQGSSAILATILVGSRLHFVSERHSSAWLPSREVISLPMS
jgi:hypothetical protein